MKKVIVIGAGTAGLASGIRLLKDGFDVEIYEKNEKPGGRMYRIEEKGFQFDVGPTIVMLPEVYNEVFEYSGVNPKDYIDMTLLNPFNTLYYPDGTKLEISSELPALIKQLEAFGPKETKGYLNYLKDVYERYHRASSNFLDRSYRNAWGFFNPKSLYQAYKLKTLNSAYTSISRFVKEEKLRQALSFQTLYIGVSPYSGPSIYTIIPMIELLYGVWYIKGGMYQMAKAMEKRFLEMGGKIHYDAPVEEILLVGNKTAGVLVNGKPIYSDILLCNADFPYAMKNLIKDEQKKGKYKNDKIDKMQYSTSSFILYIGLNKKYKTNVHSIRFASDFKRNIEELDKGILPMDPSFYLYSPSQIDPSVAPAGKELIYVLVPVPNMKSGDQAWSLDETEVYKEMILNKIERIEGFNDFKDHIEVIKTYTPKTFNYKFNLEYAATFGLKPILTQSVYFRPQNKFKTIDNLYFAGSSNHPGAGVPIVLASAKLACKEIMKDHKPNE
ncbi:MAG: phytoene desaturase family protein [Acholeplasma sp.]|nr:phytoene desaturase family protein [Acholeplasma sp.]